MNAEIAGRQETERKQLAAIEEKRKEQTNAVAVAREKQLQEQRDKNTTSLIKVVAGVAAFAIVVGIASKVFSHDSYASSVATSSGEIGMQQEISRRKDQWSKELKKKEGEAIIHQNESASKANDSFYDRKQQERENAFFEHRNETAGY